MCVEKCHQNRESIPDRAAERRSVESDSRFFHVSLWPCRALRITHDFVSTGHIRTVISFPIHVYQTEGGERVRIFPRPDLAGRAGR